jgi:hypothetical protein
VDRGSRAGHGDVWPRWARGVAGVGTREPRVAAPRRVRHARHHGGRDAHAGRADDRLSAGTGSAHGQRAVEIREPCGEGGDPRWDTGHA